MNSPLCRQCQQPVSEEDVICAHCRAPRPACAVWHGEGYEWKSAATWMGSPLVHVAFGTGSDGKLRTARGIVAIGQRAVGVISCGIIATGVVSFGVISLGVVSFGVLSVALVAAAGVNAIAPLAVGVSALGYFAGGVAPLGWKILFAPGN